MKKDLGIKLGKNFEFRGEIYKVFVFLVFILLGSRMAYLQILQKDKYNYLAQKNRVKLRKIDAERGNIYDSNGELIVTNTLGYRLVYLNQRTVTEEQLQEMSKVTGYTEDYLQRRIKYGEIVPYTKENILIEDLDLNLAHKLMEKIGDYPYLEVQNYSKRKYIYDSLAAHTIGYVKKITEKEYEALKEEGYSPRDIVGKTGIEKVYDSQMKGKPGYDYIEVNALNKAQKIEKSKDPVPGYNLHLSLDMRLQKYMEKIFEEEKLSGALIAIEAQTGKVLTMVSYPTYSLTTFSSKISTEEWNEITNDPRKPLTNKSISGEYPPGSVFKPFSAFSFFNNGLDPKTKIYDNGVYSIGKWSWKAWKKGGHGTVDFEKSIIESVNPYYYRFADQFGHEPIVDVAGNFGYGKLSKIDVFGERAGILPSEKWKRKRFKQGWFKGDTIILSIGQGYLLATPMQVAVSYMGLANRGKAYVPHVVDYLENGNDKIEVKPEILYETNYPSWYYDALNKALINTVEKNNGTTKSLRTPGLVIGAKSGSAQNSRFDETHALVAGYFPADKQPKIVFTVLLEGAGGGGSVAGGVAKKFVDKYLEYYNEEMK
ncbi:penicillin-binding protein 2 [Candidatus Cetobacterium colombiensis]|uniref:Penicillin-binding protein 2 n=1 Tax=Candidatus Cetobacterium colombiensis TaxID=3073100 RepID=A0ABU4WAC0_9FUSO|nr:penicillin-binding protein 2 [Candidatus Cetobacterium colombiensis]MDX8336482.1 penicillin-binding protein 2 [Candidatus Cetobacterium colombiensis]